MAELNNNDNRSKKGKPQSKKHSTRMDMTPMVDLAFLLLTFFMLTTTFNQPKTMEVNMPVPGKPRDVPPNTVTILIGGQNELVYYQGIFDANNSSNFHSSAFGKNGIRKSLLDLNQKLIDRISQIEQEYLQGKMDEKKYHSMINEAKKNKDNEGVFVIIKPTDEAKYEHLVLLLDEMKICNVVNYSIVDITKEEEKIIAAL